jgi:hypothetical protein
MSNQSASESPAMYPPGPLSARPRDLRGAGEPRLDRARRPVVQVDRELVEVDAAERMLEPLRLGRRHLGDGVRSKAHGPVVERDADRPVHVAVPLAQMRPCGRVAQVGVGGPDDPQPRGVGRVGTGAPVHDPVAAQLVPPAGVLGSALVRWGDVANALHLQVSTASPNDPRFR